MKNKDKTIALTLLALLLYALFVWHGMTYTGPASLPFSAVYGGLLQSSQTGNTAASQSAKPTVQPKASTDGYKRSQEGYYQFSKIKWDITSYGLKKEDGKTYLIYGFTWVNTSNEPVDFLDANVCIEAYQDGVQCESSAVYGLDSKLMTKVMPGKKLESYYVIELRNMHTVETHISEYFVDIAPVVFKPDPSKIGNKKK